MIVGRMECRVEDGELSAKETAMLSSGGKVFSFALYVQYLEACELN